jgi:hypothetical protein
MKKNWIKTLSVALALVTLLTGVTACPGGSNKKPSTEIPLVTLNRAVPTEFIYPGDEICSLATPEKGALVVNNTARVWVPPEAVVADTLVTVTMFTGEIPEIGSANPGAQELTVMSDLYDIGPDNTSFSKPAEVSIAYDDALVPNGADESEIGPIFYNGENWVPVERRVDTDKNIVTFKTGSFPGFLVGLAITAGKWAVLTAGGAGLVKLWEYSGPIAYRAIVNDPLFWGNAGKYITPDDPVVKKYAGIAKIKPLGADEKTYDLKDLLLNPDAMNAIAGKESAVKFIDGDKEYKLVYQQFDEANDWQMPGDYFSMGRRGDCKNVANAMASVYRSMGFVAKAVDGYQAGVRHGWVEFIVNGKVYYSGTAGDVMPLERAVQKMQLVRPAYESGKGYMWDENGQERYETGWWLSSLKITVDAKKAYPGGWATIKVLATAAPGKYMQVTVNRPDGTYYKDKGLTDVKGVWEVIIPVNNEDPAGKYEVTAINPETQATGKAVFRVIPWEIKLQVKNPVCYPGDMLMVQARLSPPREAALHFSGFDETRTTKANGYVAAQFAIPSNAIPGNYTMVVTDTENNLTGSVDYVIDSSASISVNITPDTVTAGGTITVDFLIDPPVAAEIKIEGFGGSWTTGADGTGTLTLVIPENTAPGPYTLVVMAPDEGLFGFGDYTVIAATSLPTTKTTSINPAQSYNLASIVLGGIVFQAIAEPVGIFDNGARNAMFRSYYMRVTQMGNHISGTCQYVYHAGSSDVPGQLNYDVWIDENNETASGSVSFSGSGGLNFSYNFEDVPKTYDKNYDWYDFGRPTRFTKYTIEGKSVLEYITKFTYLWPENSYDARMKDILTDEDTAEHYSFEVHVIASPNEDEIKKIIEENNQ